MEELERKNSIHTMKTDAEELLKKEKSSFLDLFARQSQRPAEMRPARAGKNSFLGAIAIVSIIVALGAVAFAGYTYYIGRSEPKPIQQDELRPPRPILNAEDTVLITIRTQDRTGLLGELAKTRAKPLPEGAFRYLPIIVADVNVEPHSASPAELFSTLAIEPPSDFLPSLTGRWNLYTRGFDDLIFVFETADRLRTQGSLLRWEDTMVSDFVPIVAGALSSGAGEFTDGIVKNIDTRTARLSETADAAIGYSIVLGKYLILATQESALAETIGRLIAQPSAG